MKGKIEILHEFSFSVLVRDYERNLKYSTQFEVMSLGVSMHMHSIIMLLGGGRVLYVKFMIHAVSYTVS